MTARDEVVALLAALPALPSVWAGTTAITGAPRVQIRPS